MNLESNGNHRKITKKYAKREPEEQKMKENDGFRKKQKECKLELNESGTVAGLPQAIG